MDIDKVRALSDSELDDALRDAKQTSKARAMFQQIIDKYPRSDEADLARDILKTLK